MTALMRAQNLTKRYNDVAVLRDVSLTVNHGDIIGIIGPSGAGKSTLIRCLNALEPVDAGEIYLDDIHLGDRRTNLDRVRSRIGFVFQDFNLFTHLTIRRNVMIGLLKVKRMKRAEAEEIARRELDRVGLADKLESYPAELSGGQQQRASIARALAMEPELMLFDEPTSALDPESVGGVLRIMRELARDGMTMIVVSHEMAFIKAVASDVIFMVDGQIHEEGSAKQLFEQPQQTRTRDFFRGLADDGGEPQPEDH